MEHAQQTIERIQKLASRGVTAEVMQALEKSGMMQKHNEAKAAKQGYQQESAQ